METEVKSDNIQRSAVEGSSSSSEDEFSFFREHEPLDDLLSQIPRKAQKGMLTQCDLILTCIDANEDYISLGSNVGIVFLFDRKKRAVERKLKTESNNDTISVVRLHKGFDSQVAAGTNGGIIYIFQLPSHLPGQNKQLQQYVVQSLHHSSISSLAWSLNGMKLFSGDKKGLVLCTDVDFYEKQCKSSVIMEEKQSEIVQLHHAHKSLLVSTCHRSLIYRSHLSENQIVQVGKKDRKILGNYGACFIPGLCKPEDAQLYAARPGLRIWKAAINGVVLNTNLFKDVLSEAHRDIPIIPYAGQTRTQLQSSDQQFGILLLYREKYLVTWTTTHLYVLNPDNTTVVASQARLGVLTDVVIAQDDIFVLRKNTSRNVVRLGLKPLAKHESVYERLVKERQMAAEAVKNKQLQEGHTESTTDKSEKPSKSPLRFLQQNVLDKFKVLEKVAGAGAGNSVSHLVSSMDRLGPKYDDEDDHSHEIDRSQLDSQSDTSKQSHDFERTSPSKVLPPVVQLDSPDLLTIEIFSGIPPTQETYDKSVLDDNKQFSYKSAPLTGRFNPFLRDPVSDAEAEEICTDTFDKISAQTEQNNKDSLSENRDVPQPSEEGKQPKFLIEKLDQVLKKEVQNSSEDIVFTHKHKVRKRKKHMDKTKDDKKVDESHGTATKHKHSEDTDQGDGNDEDIGKEKSEEEDSGTVTPDSKSEEPLRMPLGMEEPENVELFETMSKSIDNFEKSLSDLPPSSSEVMEKKGENEEVNEETAKEDKSGDEKLEELRSKEEEEKWVPPKVKDSSHSDIEKRETEGSEAENEETESVEMTVAQTDENKDTLSVIEENIIESNSGKQFDVLETAPVFVVESATPLAEDSVEDEEGEESIYSPKKPKEESVKGNMGDTIHSQTESKKEPFKDKMDDLINDSQKYFGYKTPDSSVEDFYGRAGSTPSPVSESAKTLAKTASKGKATDKKHSKTMDPSAENIPPSLINNWMTTTTAGNLFSIAISNSHIWVVDKSCNIYYSALQGGRLKWVKVRDYAHQIAVSRSGYIVWRLYKETVHAGTKITGRHPEGMKWVEAVRGVQFIAVDNTCAWYIKTTGEVMIQTGLSKDRPCFKSRKVTGDSKYRLKQIVCQEWVVWGVTEECKLVYREGVTHKCPEGTGWAPNEHAADDMLFSYVALGDNDIGWGIDVLGRIWFISGVTMDTPMGQECWWQVPMSEILVQDVTALDTLKSLASKFDPQKLAYLLSTQRGGLITAGEGGIWVCPEFKNTLQICRGSMEGHSWHGIRLAGFTSSIAWKILSASVSSYDHGLIWCTQPNGDVFAMTRDARHCKMVDRPSLRDKLVAISTCTKAVWGLMENGQVYIRSGIRKESPQGTDWVHLDLQQLGDVHLVSVSCGCDNVWAVDSDGVVYQRIGVKAPSSHSLIQAWLPVDSGSMGTSFSQIISGPKDWMVWAIDNRRQVYTRTGISDTMPIGTNWVHVPGTHASQITISERSVWALNPQGEILCRYGVTTKNPTGDYWRKIPGIFIHISVSPLDDLWAISREGHIYKRLTQCLLRKQSGSDPLLERGLPRGLSSSSDDGWELL